MNQKFLLTQSEPLPFQTRLEGQDARHIFKVLRLGAGDDIHLTDGKGTDYMGRILNASASNVEIDVYQAGASSTESPLEITLCSAMLKDKKMDLVIKHVTQLGIYQWIPFYSKRSIPRPSSKRVASRHDRWQTLSKESIKQCRRSRVVDIAMPVSFQTVLDKADPDAARIVFWENETQPLHKLQSPPLPTKAVILIGPEGGFTKDEIDSAKASGFICYSMGPRILRAETAAISACTLVQHILGDI